MTARIAAGLWLAYAAAAGLMALFALVRWGQALALAAPVLYGEGAVAHAAILARTFATYSDAGGPSFTAANYPPLYFLLASVGDPFVTGRLLSVIATIGIAVLVGRRAWRGGRLTATALALGWLALSPVAVWGAAVKPDLVALALTVAAVLALERRRAGLAAALLAAAAATKPTALLPAIALLAWVAWKDRALLRPFVASLAIAAAVAVVAAVPLGYAGLWRHVVVLNALPWSGESALLLAFLAVFLLGALVGAALLTRGFDGPIAAYAAAALCIVALGGREGGTINYLLDLAAAGSLGLAAAASRVGRTPLYPALAIASLAVAAVLLDPLGIVPGRIATTGAWADPARLATVRAALASDEAVLAEDSGLLLATGHRVVVDDLFLWSRSVANGTVDPAPLLGEVAAARFTAIVAETDLSQLAAGPAYERSRWEPSLVRTILDRYRIASRTADGLVIYRPR